MAGTGESYISAHRHVVGEHLVGVVVIGYRLPGARVPQPPEHPDRTP